MYKYHKILEEPHHKYKIIDFRYYCDSSISIIDHFIDLKLKKDSTIRNLRFIAPRNISLEKGFPNISGFAILNIKDSQLEGVSLEVMNDEPEYGELNFYAKNVIDLNKEENKYLLKI
ncbi:MAG: hypothetical protein KAT32_03150 [Candidatus Moranbacteria bacterium]|nr:hypothetical protein [Candidatus Moranbacteria bacterium]